MKRRRISNDTRYNFVSCLPLVDPTLSSVTLDCSSRFCQFLVLLWFPHTVSRWIRCVMLVSLTLVSCLLQSQKCQKNLTMYLGQHFPTDMVSDAPVDSVIYVYTPCPQTTLTPIFSGHCPSFSCTPHVTQTKEPKLSVKVEGAKKAPAQDTGSSLWNIVASTISDLCIS